MTTTPCPAPLPAPAVVVDAASAARLVREGAIVLDAVTGRAVCDGLPVPVPRRSPRPARPVLVTGPDAAALRVLALLEERGVPAWRVLHPSGPLDGLDAELPPDE